MISQTFFLQLSRFKMFTSFFFSFFFLFYFLQSNVLKTKKTFLKRILFNFNFFFLLVTESSTKVYVTGVNSYGELGFDPSSVKQETEFIENESLRGTIQIAGGSYHAIALFGKEKN